MNYFRIARQVFGRMFLVPSIILLVLVSSMLGGNTLENQSASETPSVLASSPNTIKGISQITATTFTLKKEGFEDTGQQFGKEVDHLQNRMVSLNSEWLNTEVIWGITILKLIFGIFAFLTLFTVHFLLRRFIRKRQKIYELSSQSLEELTKKSKPLTDPILEALNPPLFLFIWIYGGLTIIAFLFSHITAGDKILWIPQAAGQIAEIGGFVAFFWTIFRLIKLLDIKLNMWANSTPSDWDSILVPFVGKCLRFFLPLTALIFSLPFFKLSPEIAKLFQNGVSVVIIGSIAWILMQLVLVVEQVILSPLSKDRKADIHARKIFTQVHILKKVLLTVIWIFSFSLMLMVFDSVRQLGTSIMASAGVIGIIVGFAAQRTIALLLAGLQIAITQPIRIDDVVIVEGEWGWVEEINLTYVVVKIWDLRRLVLPINYFIEKPFQNWTRTSSKILGSIFFYVDYTFPVEELRKSLIKIVAASSSWDGDVCGLQVTDTKPTFIEIRALVSAENSSKAWDLRCEVREKILSHIQKNYPQCLPMVRARLESESPSAKIKSATCSTE